MSELRRDLADAARSLASALARLSLDDNNGEWEVVVDPADIRFLARSLPLASREARATRAWKAGFWAGEVLAGRLDFPWASDRIAVRSTIYVVLRCDALSGPASFRGFRAFKNAVGALEHSNTVCHGFPTEETPVSSVLGPTCALIFSPPIGETEEPSDFLALPVLCHSAGFLLALPPGTFSEGLGQQGDSEVQVGPSFTTSVAGLEEDEAGIMQEVSLQVPCLVVDLKEELASYLRKIASPPSAFSAEAGDHYDTETLEKRLVAPPEVPPKAHQQGTVWPMPSEAIFQGDHLGVEVATCLIIHHYFSISFEERGPPPADRSAGVEKDLQEVCLEKVGGAELVIPLPRSVADELVVVSALTALAVSDLSAQLLPEVFATDSSEDVGIRVGAISDDLKSLGWTPGPALDLEASPEYDLRQDLPLPLGRPVEKQTQRVRDRLWDEFAAWLRGNGLDLEAVFGEGAIDIDFVNIVLGKYGRELYQAGDCFNRPGTSLFVGCGTNLITIMLRCPGRHQSLKVDHPDLIEVIEFVFSGLPPGQKLWPMSDQSFRNRFQRILAALHLQRGRWLTSKIMEIYIQEVSALQFLPALPKADRDYLLDWAGMYS
ncbi:HERC6 [Symbiodinium sp. CCMP2592]|nr:HERC6 [Symbiodinium sp. CCMP2592]